jgi:hypothetical protein
MRPKGWRSEIMGVLIAFPVERVKLTGAVSAAAAEVVIFPGVRVERLMFDLSERLPAVRSGSAAAQLRTGEFEFY